MSERQIQRFLLYFAAAGAVLSLAFLLLRYIFWWVLPFLLAFALCAGMEPAITFLQRHFHFSRNFSAACTTCFLLFVAGGLLSLLLSTLLSQATTLLRELPQLLASLPALIENLLARIELYCAHCPVWLQDYLARSLSDLMARGSAALDSLAARLLSLLPSVATAFPRFLLGAATTILAVYYTSASYPSLCATVRKNCSTGNLRRLRLLRSGASQSLGRWLRAELTLSLITFLQLFIGFIFLRQKFSLLLAVLITLVDALPVFGAGTVLLPWALGTLLFGSSAKGLLLCLLYLSVLLVRNIFEPKLMAQQAGLPPITSLAAMYLGFCLFGVGGMIFFPFLLLFLTRVYQLSRGNAQ